jgi:hypothetical protein
MTVCGFNAWNDILVEWKVRLKRCRRLIMSS